MCNPCGNWLPFHIVPSGSVMGRGQTEKYREEKIVQPLGDMKVSNEMF